MSNPRNILVTGGSGFIGCKLVDVLCDQNPGFNVICFDVRPPKDRVSYDNYEFIQADIRQLDKLQHLLSEKKIDTIVHLASIVTPPPGMTREDVFQIDVIGTRNVIDAAIKTGVEQLIVTSSGAAYGYYADNAEWITEDHAIRGNQSFAYSDHKRLVEEMLAECREKHPGLKQLILRPGTVLGDQVNNQITDLFKKPFILGVLAHPSPFVFIWDRDLVQIILRGITQRIHGIFNVAGDGALSGRQIAKLLGKRYLPLPDLLLRGGLALLKVLKLTQYGPEQVKFIKYRPVLLNEKLKMEFGYTPDYTTKEAFISWQKSEKTKEKN